MSKTMQTIILGIISAVTVLVMLHLQLNDLLGGILTFVIVLIAGMVVQYFAKTKS
ncbi:hypothetical protein [Lacticaseibacillus salsurivasis]|uniref:hypothetical protein n=1 Tax=Lacticaseibacillus salsurivasis TaxID=3081441 RepID=UPI0030C74992